MPDRLQAWSTGWGEGNPFSLEVNDLIKKVKRLEARKQGASSQTRQTNHGVGIPLHPQDIQGVWRSKQFNNLEVWHAHIDQLSVSHDCANRRCHTGKNCAWCFSLLLLDADASWLTSRLLPSNLTDNSRTSSCAWLNSQCPSDKAELVQECKWWARCTLAGCSREHGSDVLCHFKSGIVVGDEFARECVCWIIPVCVFVFGRRWIAFWWLESKGDRSDNIWSEDIQTRGISQIGMLGSHTIWKFAATHALRCGVTKDEKDIWGRWKGKGRVSDVYNDVALPYPDCKVVEMLASNGRTVFLFNQQQQDLQCDGHDYLDIE